jgi:hypothetical protein
MTAQRSSSVTPISLGEIRVPCKFETLKAALLNLGQSSAQNSGVTLTDDLLTAAGIVVSSRFLVVVTAEFRVLLQAELAAAEVTEAAFLSFEAETITAFLKKMRSQVAKQPSLKAQFTQALAIPVQPSGAASVYEALIQQLCELLTQQQPTEQHPSASSCRPIVDAAH